MFRAVRAINLRQRYERLEIGLADPAEEPAELRDLLEYGARVFTVTDGGSDGYVVASAVYLSEDHLSYGEPSTIDHPELADRIVRSGYFGG
ncbi:hypothetical protein [Amycolatopsis sp. WGS_07]|uniref:hypothetical protein n=1 Tax=Amycolatopsis sp. WGS_07 TaxID=3076764 RepID=UPI0038734008